MAGVSVVHFNSNNNSSNSGGSPQKIITAVLQQQSTNNSNSNHSAQQTNNNSDRREIIILRKNPHILPQPKDYNNTSTTTKQEILITNNSGRKKSHHHHHQQQIIRTKDNTAGVVRTNPQPIAVARRNARERNRVKQVNNGFANLRQHIPSFIAAAFESNTKGGSKKLSKVETLRMAVEYIRSLEDILAMDDNNSEQCSSVSSPNLPSYQMMSPSADEDDLSSTNPTPPPPRHSTTQYIRIDPLTNTYQIISTTTDHLYDDSENLEPLSIEDHLLGDPSSLIDPAALEFGASSQDLLLNSDSLSPGMYSDQSLSPSPNSSTTTTGGGFDKSDLTGNGSFTNVIFRDDSGVCVDSSNFVIKMEQPSSCQPSDQHILDDLGGDVPTNDGDIPVISLKTEHELPTQVNKGEMMDMMQWWEQQQSPHILGGGRVS